MALSKKFLKNKPVCKVTFNIDSGVTKDAKKVFLVGEFNGWKVDSTPMRKLKDGSFTRTLDLDTGRSYQFRYLVDGRDWQNDGQADGYEYSPFGNCENSVVTV
ncbi:glycoside hydrolase family 13 domain protein [Desulfovibrio sp. X2]|uniref:isoamylase early set domain-containing protein n=1 Tax=Desulfovibrio sp. X2 TaxID=941449 RepID=UPI000358AA75|nr:isoamylase early set domain-containing protein [Desulfovibrio sp. X2]EPR42417.1 glycoside hydrolase family 13 domain protein [Desulfovibrio sp. X2]